MRVFLTSPRYRRLRFVAVGGTCFVVQLGVLHVLYQLGMPRPAANSVGFEASAQLNFALSSVLTWRDRAVADRRALLARLAAYNAAALISLAANTMAFTLVYRAVGDTVGAAIGVVCGMGLTYLGCDRLIFRTRRPTARHRRLNSARLQEETP